MVFARRALILTLLVLGAVPAASFSETYDVYTCTLPNGRPAPTEGWRYERSSEPRTLVSNTCADPAAGASVGAFGAELGDRTVDHGYAGWFFTAPKSTTISNVTLFRTVHMVTGPFWSTLSTISYGLRGSVDQQHFAEFCTPWASCWDRGSGGRDPFAVANKVSASGLEARQLNAELSCHREEEAPSCDPGPTMHGWRSTPFVSASPIHTSLSSARRPSVLSLPPMPRLRARRASGSPPPTEAAGSRRSVWPSMALCGSYARRSTPRPHAVADRLQQLFRARSTPAPRSRSTRRHSQTARTPCKPRSSTPPATRRGRIPWS